MLPYQIMMNICNEAKNVNKDSPIGNGQRTTTTVHTVTSQPKYLKAIAYKKLCPRLRPCRASLKIVTTWKMKLPKTPKTFCDDMILPLSSNLNGH